MEQNNKYYFNSKLYDTKLRRLAVFGREIDGKLEIFEETCSKSDNFKKLTAKVLYDCYILNGKKGIPTKFHPKIYTIDIKEGDSAKFTFDNHCRFGGYLHKFTETTLLNKDFYGVYKENEGFKRVK